MTPASVVQQALRAQPRLCHHNPQIGRPEVPRHCPSELVLQLLDLIPPVLNQKPQNHFVRLMACDSDRDYFTASKAKF